MQPGPSLPDIMDDAACQRALSVLVDIGMSIAQQLEAPSTEVSVTARAKAFDAVSLAVRRTIILSRHIAQSPIKPVCDEARRVAARKQVIRAVEQEISTKADKADAPDLRVELLERIDSPDFDADLARRSAADLIMELCNDLGLANLPGLTKYKRRTPDDIAILCAQAAAPPGSGLAQSVDDDGVAPWTAAPAEFHRPDQRRHQ